jgi:hypothetical protein
MPGEARSSRRRLRGWIRRAHVWLGLLSCTALITFGAAGMTTAWRQRPWKQPVPPRIVEMSYEAPSGATDAEIADGILETLAVPFRYPVPERALRRDSEGRLTFQIYTPNADYRVEVAADDRSFRAETRQAGLAEFLNRVHAIHPRQAEAASDWRVRLWSFYVEFSVWAVLAMPLTGLYLWVRTRPRYRLALLGFGLAVVSSIVFYLVVR